MEISGSYSSPVTVNGFSCRNCSEVAQAEKNIDPARPTSGKASASAPANESVLSKEKPDFFSNEARDTEKMEKLQEGRARSVSSVAGAYESAFTPPGSGQFVSRTA